MVFEFISFIVVAFCAGCAIPIPDATTVGGAVWITLKMVAVEFEGFVVEQVPRPNDQYNAF